MPPDTTLLWHKGDSCWRKTARERKSDVPELGTSPAYLPGINIQRTTAERPTQNKSVCTQSKEEISKTALKTKVTVLGREEPSCLDYPTAPPRASEQ